MSKHKKAPSIHKQLKDAKIKMAADHNEIRDLNSKVYGWKDRAIKAEEKLGNIERDEREWRAEANQIRGRYEGFREGVWAVFNKDKPFRDIDRAEIGIGSAMGMNHCEPMDYNPKKYRG